MQAKYKVALALAAGFTLGAGAIQALHAQAKPSYVIGMINVKDEEGYKSNFLKEAQKQIANHGGKYVAGGFNKTTAHWLAA
jgi:ABC-type sugar transport system substrate-binding protein